MAKPENQIRQAEVEDAPAVGRLLHDFNTEFDEPTPAVEEQTRILLPLLTEEEISVLLAGQGPEGFALLRFRPAIQAAGLEAHLQELYVVPPRRGQGIGRALLTAAFELARAHGAVGIDLNTGESDTAARGLYESMGFTNRESSAEGPAMLFYEREI